MEHVVVRDDFGSKLIRGPRSVRAAGGGAAIPAAVRGYAITVGGGGYRAPVNVSVTAEACIRVLSQTVADLDVRVRAGDREMPAPAWLRMPMPGWGFGWTGWTEAFIGDLLRGGNAYVVPIRDRSGRPVEVWLLPPIAVTSEVAADGRHVQYRIGGAGVWAGEMLHCRYLTRTGHVDGIGPLQWASREAQTGAYVGDLAQRLVRDGLHQSGFYRVAGQTTASQIADLRDTIAQHHGGLRNAHQQMVLTGDVDYQSTAVTPRDAELDGLSTWSAQEICRAFGVPPSLVGVAETGSVPYKNSHESMFHFHLFGLAPLIRKAERLWSSLLPARQHADLDERPMLRGAPQSRARVLATMGKIPGAFTYDELREVMGLGPLPDGSGVEIAGPAPAPPMVDAPPPPANDDAGRFLATINGGGTNGSS